MPHIDNYVEGAWDVSPSFTDKLKAFDKECGKNWPLERDCILACEIGDIVGTYTAAGMGLKQASNLIGYGVGVSFGLGWGARHVYRHAKDDKINPSLTDLGKAVLTAEIACTSAATAVPAILGAAFGASFDEVQTIVDISRDIAIRFAALGPAIPVGLVAMSALSLPKKAEVTRLAAEKGRLEDVAEFMKRNYGNVEYNPRKKSVILNGNHSKIRITEKPVPRMYKDKCDILNDSLYLVTSSAARYSDEARRSAYGLACKVFDGVGLENHSHPSRLGSHDGHGHSEESKGMILGLADTFKGLYAKITGIKYEDPTHSDHHHNHEGHHH